jgi:uncharacterized membrane protein
MALLAVGSFWLDAGVPPIAMWFGPTHLRSLVVLHGLWRGVTAARAGDHAFHAGWMRGLHMPALIVAGLLTLLPGRTLNAMLFPDRPGIGVLLIAVIGLGLVGRRLRILRRPVAG